MIGDHCKIGKDVEIDSFTVIGDHVIVEDDASLKRAVVWSDAYIGERAALRGCVVGKGCRVKANVSVFEGAVIGDGCTLEEGSQVKSAVKLWPDKVIGPGTVVSTTVVWGSRWGHSLFGPSGVAGLANIDLHPEFAAKLGAAYGSCLGKGARVAVGRDSHKASQMIQDALMAGIVSTGVEVENLGAVPAPVAACARHDP